MEQIKDERVRQYVEDALRETLSGFVGNAPSQEALCEATRATIAALHSIPAITVKCDFENNTPESIAAGYLHVEFAAPMPGFPASDAE